MVEQRLSSVFVRFTAEYGMVFVLLSLGAVFSLTTARSQNPGGAAAGHLLADQILSEVPDNADVLIVVGETILDTRFAEVLAQDLDQRGATVVQVVQGGPSQVRQTLEEIASRGTVVDVIACQVRQSRYRFIRRPSSELKPLADARVMVPQPYFWPDFLKISNIRAIANRVVLIAIIAIGMTFVIITGGIDLSVGSLIAFSAVVTALLIRMGGAAEATAGVMVLSGLAAIALCGALGAFSGSMVTVFQVPAFIVTLGMMQVARGLAFILSDSQSIYQVPESFTLLGRGFVLGIPNPVLLMLMLYAVAHVMMTRMTLGRYIYAVGGNKEAARLSGVPVRRVLLICYTACGALAGLGGVITASQLKSGEPNYGDMAELEVIAAVVVGGTSLSGGEGKVLGTLIGALVMAVIRNGMNLMNIEPNVQRVVLGIVILGAVLLDKLKKSGWRLPRD